jgi:uncharacterized membrane protein YoaK (UPF0700 family)
MSTPAAREHVQGGRQARDLLLVALTVSTGAVDALSWLGLGKVFSVFMTGNLVFLGLRTGGAAGPSVLRVLAAVAAFAVGALLSARLVRKTQDDGEVWPRRVTLALAGALGPQAVFAAVWATVGGHPSSAAGDLLIALSALAMGMQTTAIFSLGVRAVFTTAATATFAVLMGDLSGWTQASGERRRLSAVIVGLFAGVVLGAILVVHALRWAPLFPLGLTALVVAAAARVFEGAGSCARRPGRSAPVAPLR